LRICCVCKKRINHLPAVLTDSFQLGILNRELIGSGNNHMNGYNREQDVSQPCSLFLLREVRAVPAKNLLFF